MHARSSYNSSLTAAGCLGLLCAVVFSHDASGQHSAGLCTLNRYSHFSGSATDSSSLVVPQVMSTLTLRSGPFQHLALTGRVRESQLVRGISYGSRLTLCRRAVSNSTPLIACPRPRHSKRRMCCFKR